MKGAQYSMPLKFAVGSLFGQDPLDVMANSYFENKLMKLHEDLVPLSSSFTTSSTAFTKRSSGKTGISRRLAESAIRAAFKSGRKHTILPSSVVYAFNPSKQA